MNTKSFGLKLPFALAMLISGCAAPVVYSPGLRLLGQSPAAADPPPVRAVRGDFRASLRADGRKMRLDVVVFVDSSHGRLEAIGPMGVPLASVLWNDSSWQVYMPLQSTLIQGRGDTVRLPVLGLRTFVPSSLAGPLLGQFLPPGANPSNVRILPASSSRSVVLPRDQQPLWSLLLDRRTGLPVRSQELSRGREVMGIEFFDWKSIDRRPVPYRIRQTSGPLQELELQLQTRQILDSMPPEALKILIPSAIDTLQIEQDPEGRFAYHVRPAVPVADSLADAPVEQSQLENTTDSLVDDYDSTQDFSDSLDDADLEEDSTSLEDSLDEPREITPAAPKLPRPTSLVPSGSTSPRVFEWASVDRDVVRRNGLNSIRSRG